MQDHEAFILFKQKVNLVIENLENKIEDTNKQVDLIKNKIEDSEHALIELQNELKFIDFEIKKIDDSVARMK